MINGNKAVEAIRALLIAAPKGVQVSKSRADMRTGYNAAILDAITAVSSVIAAQTGKYFVHDPEAGITEILDTDEERAKAHDELIDEWRAGANADGEWSEGVEHIVSGIVTHTTESRDYGNGSVEFDAMEVK